MRLRSSCSSFFTSTRRRAALGVFLTACLGAAQAEVGYLVTDLGGERLRGREGDSVATGINAAGDVSGYSSPSRGWRAGLFRAGRWIPLGDLPEDSVAQAINDAGQVAGTVDSGRISSGAEPRAFVWERGQLRWLGGLGGGSSIARAISPKGEVTGMATTRSGERHAFVTRDGAMVDLGTLPGGVFSEGYGVNAAGEVAGFAGIGDFRFHAFAYREGRMLDLGTLPGGANSYAYGINARGQITGVSGTGIERPGRPKPSHAFVHEDGKMKDLGSLIGPKGQSGGLALNAKGDIAGWSEAHQERSHAIRVRDGRMSDLNDLIDPASGWVLSEGVGINDKGQIVGNGVLRGRQRAFLLTPIELVPATRPVAVGHTSTPPLGK